MLPRERVTACLGLVAVGALEFAHAVAATNGQWVTNDKTLLSIGGMSDVDELVRHTLHETTPERLSVLVQKTTALGRRALGHVG